jgi:coenzyme F420-reducing hydrogenase delta subunit
MTYENGPTLALFYCQNIPECTESHRQALEEKHGRRLRLFPIPCSGRLEPVHLLRALETFADAAYVVTCPEGACRYFEGNRRARKRVERTRQIISAIGLEAERVGIEIGSRESPQTLAQWAEALLERASSVGPSPVLSGARAA